MHAALLSILLATAPIAHGFTVDFWLGERCTSEPEGSYEVSYSSSGTCIKVPVDAQSATVEYQPEVDGTVTSVAFYQNDDCTGTLEASTTQGCIDFTGAGGNAGSFIAVLNSQDNGERVRRRKVPVLPPWNKMQVHAREQLGIHADNATGSLSPQWDPYASVAGGFGHGNVTERWGKVWKWQQVALGITIGIPVEEWDDNIHVLNNTFIPFSDNAQFPAASTVAHADGVYKRWDYANCRALLSCSRVIYDAAAANIGNGWAQGVAAAYRVVPFGQTFYDWAHGHPFSVSIAITSVSTSVGYVLGKSGGGATAQDNDQLLGCSDDRNQANAFVQSLIDAADAGADNAGQVDITLPNGHILTISAEVYPADHPPPQNTVYCDAN